mmetsp:Transcript_13705/g.27318  ORF Transcript_13705/g.27318 Transcript_13705/m.27318 type:complete len:141 (-) Transcript_13705:1373-1795(-)
MSDKPFNWTAWSAFFLAAGASNISQALFFHYAATPRTSAAAMLGTIGSKAPKPSPATWAVVTAAGGLYSYHGWAIGTGVDGGGLHKAVIGVFAGLKFAVSHKMYKILSHPKGRPGPATAFICATEVVWGGAFAYWAATAE